MSVHDPLETVVGNVYGVNIEPLLEFWAVTGSSRAIKERSSCGGGEFSDDWSVELPEFMIAVGVKYITIGGSSSVIVVNSSNKSRHSGGSGRSRGGGLHSGISVEDRPEFTNYFIDTVLIK